MAENILAQKRETDVEVSLSALLAVQDLQPLGGLGLKDSTAIGDDKTPQRTE